MSNLLKTVALCRPSSTQPSLSFFLRISPFLLLPSMILFVRISSSLLSVCPVIFFPILLDRSTWSAQPYKLPTIPYLSDLWRDIGLLLSSHHTTANSPHVYTPLCTICVWNFDATWYKCKEWDFNDGAMIYETVEAVLRNLRVEGSSLLFDILTWFVRRSWAKNPTILKKKRVNLFGILFGSVM